MSFLGESSTKAELSHAIIPNLRINTASYVFFIFHIEPSQKRPFLLFFPNPSFLFNMRNVIRQYSDLMGRVNKTLSYNKIFKELRNTLGLCTICLVDT